MGSGLLSRVKQLEENVRRLQGRFQGPPWHRVVIALEGESEQQTFDRLGIPLWDRPSTGRVRYLVEGEDPTPQEGAVPAQGTAGER